MRHAAGVALFAFGAWLAWSALAQRRRVIAARPAGMVAREGEAAGNARLSMTGEIMRPIILFALVYLALKSVFAYVVLDAGRWVSWFDPAGSLPPRGVRRLGRGPDEVPRGADRRDSANGRRAGRRRTARRAGPRPGSDRLRIVRRWFSG